jgi:hypothetical protein
MAICAFALPEWRNKIKGWYDAGMTLVDMAKEIEIWDKMEPAAQALLQAISADPAAVAKIKAATYAAIDRVGVDEVLEGFTAGIPESNFIGGVSLPGVDIHTVPPATQIDAYPIHCTIVNAEDVAVVHVDLITDEDRMLAVVWEGERRTGDAKQGAPNDK